VCPLGQGFDGLLSPAGLTVGWSSTPLCVATSLSCKASRLASMSLWKSKPCCSREANPEKLPKKGCRGPSVLQAGN